MSLLHVSLKNVSHSTRKNEEMANNINSYWQAKENGRAQLLSLREDRIKEDKEIDAIDFELTKGEYKLDQADRRLRVINADLEEVDYQIEQLEAAGVFPDSIWSMNESI
jgi:uncharacterized protein YhaN